MICSKRMAVSVKGRTSVNGQALKLRWMKFGCLLFVVQEHDEEELPDNNAFHSPQCTELYELVCYLKFTNIPVAATHNSPRQRRSLVMFCKLEGDKVFGAKIVFSGEDSIHLSEYANRHNVRFWCATFPLRCLEVRRLIPSLTRFVLCPNSVPFGSFTFADTVTSVVCLNILDEFLIPSQFSEKRVQKTC
jgi:hypothetical protein